MGGDILGALWRAMRANKLVAVITAAGFAGLLNWIGYLQTGFGLVTLAYGPGWTWAIVLSSVPFKLICAFAVVWGLWRIGRAAVAEERKQGEATRAALIKETQRAARDRAILLQVKMAKAVLLSREILVLDQWIKEVIGDVEAFDTQSQRWLGNETFTVASLMDGPPPAERVFTRFPPQLRSFAIPAPRCAWHLVQAELPGTGQGHYRSFDPATPANTLARGMIQNNVGLAKQHLNELRGLSVAQQKRIEQLNADLEKELASYDA